MRNWFDDNSCPGEEIKGTIIDGKKYEDGNVSQEQYDYDMSVINQKLETIDNSISAIDERVKELENAKPPIEIESFTISPRVAELGSTAAATLSWTLSRDEDSANINGINVTGQRSYSAAVITEKTTYRLTVTDEKGREATASAAFSFINQIYWGVSSAESLTADQIKSLPDKVLSDTKSRTIIIDPADQYVYYALPKRLGSVTFRLGQFVGGFNDPLTLSITNQFGFAEDYYVYRSENKYNVKAEFIVS